MKNTLGVPIATTHVGAFARPSWYTYAFHGRAVREMTMDVRWREAYTDAVKLAIKEQEFLGVDVLTDNRIAYDPYIPAWGWPAFVIERLDGVKMDPLRSRAFKHRVAPIMTDYNESIPGYTVVGKLGRGRLELAHFFRLAQQWTNKPIKVSVIDPVMVSGFVYNDYYKDKRDLMFDMARVYNEEFRDLAAAGCKIIQTDDFPVPLWVGYQPNPVMGQVVQEQVKDQIEAFNEAVKGVGAQIWMHYCWGRPRNQFLFGQAGSWADGFKHLAEAKADVIEIEAASTQGKNLETELKAWKQYCPDKEIGIGVVNHRTTIVETPEQVADIIRKALKFVPPERLCVSTDCGLAAIPRDIAFFKLKSMVDGARMVRKELGLESA